MSQMKKQKIWKIKYFWNNNKINNAYNRKITSMLPKIRIEEKDFPKNVYSNKINNIFKIKIKKKVN